jgi:acetate kinase
VTEAILTLNAGSSSVKFAVYGSDADEPDLLARGQVEGIGTAPRFVVRDDGGELLSESYWEAVGGGEGHNLAFQQIARWLDDFMGERTLMAVGHRVAHGGERYGQPVLIDEDVLGELNRLIPLVPLHQPNNLAAIRAVISRIRICPRWPVSILLSIAAARR